MNIPHYHSSITAPAPVQVNPPVIPYNKCIAKTAPDGSPGSTVVNHGVCAAEVGRILYRRLPKIIKDQLPPLKVILLVISLHDVGKIIPRFQRKIYGDFILQIIKDVQLFDDQTLEKYHATVSEIALLDYYRDHPNISPYAEALGAHHGLRDVDYPDPDTWSLEHDNRRNGGPLWSEERKKFIAHMEGVFGKPVFTKVQPEYLDYLMAFVVFCDWLSSDEKNFDPAIKNVSKSTHARAIASVDKLGWIKPKFKKGLTFKKIFGKDPYPEQKAFFDHVKKPGVYILQDTTGRGKSEAAFYASYRLWSKGYHLSGAYMGMPTRITSDRIFKRFDRFVRKVCDVGNSPKIIHGQNILSDMIINGVSDTAVNDVGEGELKPGGMFFGSNRRALLLPFAVGTIDQILLAVIQSRFRFFRSMGIAGKVVIIDEVHSYDAYTGKLVDFLIRRLRELGCTVIILSATLTAQRKCELLGKYPCIRGRYPLMTVKTGKKARDIPLPTNQPTKIVTLKRVLANIPKLVEEARKRAAKGQVVLLLFNSVDRAVDAYLRLAGTANKVVMHSRFPLYVRIPRETLWMSKLEPEDLENPKNLRPNGCVIVGTQVLEQSLDIDVDFLITELAPMDFLVQRIGRLWRFFNLSNRSPSAKKPEVWVFTPPLKGVKDRLQFFKIMDPNSRIYDEFLLYRTHKVLKSVKQIRMPKDLTGLIEKVYRPYSKKKDPKWLAESWEKLEQKRDHLRELAMKARGIEHWENEEEADLSPTDDAPEGTRRISVPTSALLLTKSLHETDTTVDIDLMDGQHVTISKGKRDYAAVKALLCNVVKVVDTKTLIRYKEDNQNNYSPDWIREFLYGSPIPVMHDPVSLTLRMYDACATSIGYQYTDELGAYRPLA